MEFDSLAFSAVRVAHVQDQRIYCSACCEDCTPDRDDPAVPTCPTCGQATTIRPSREATLRPTALEETSGNDASALSHTSPSASTEGNEITRLPAPPPSEGVVDAAVATGSLAAGTPAVSARVAQEVLAFMAAIERGDMPAAVGLPAPPGTLVEELPGFGATVGTRRDRSAPALEQVVKSLPRVQVDENSWVLHQTVLRLKGTPDVTFDALFAPFSPPPAEPVTGKVVLAVPPTAESSFENEADIKGSILVMDRGVCTFASKALRANAAEAAAAVIVQTHDVWPYVMEDSRGEAKTGGGLDIPVCMVSKAKGEVIKKAVRAAARGETVKAELSVSSSEKDCIVCQELYAVGATLVRLPCDHLYHEACLLKWLKISNTCPYCRRALPSSNEDVERDRVRRESAGPAGHEAWRDFFD